MSSNKKIKTYTSILSYLEDRDEEMYQIIIDLGIKSHFDLKGKAGITFINPVGDAIRQRLVDLSGGSSEDLDSAIEILSAHVIYDYLKSPDDFRSKYDDIPNALNQRVEISRDKTNSNKIVLANGGDAIIDQYFNTKKKLAIYDLQNGSIPTNGPEATGKYIRRHNTSSNGQANDSIDVNNELTKQIRLQIKDEVEKEFAYYAKRSRIDKLAKNTFLTSSLSLIHHILTREKDIIDSVYYERILPIISFTPADFYLLVEPYRNNGNYIIPNGVIERWYSRREKPNYGILMNTIIGHLEETKTKVGIFNDRYRIQSDIDEIRHKLQNPRNPRKYPELICDHYKNLISKNSSGKVRDLFPPQLIEHIYGNHLNKLVEDEMRYLLNSVYEDLDSEYDSGKYRHFAELAENYMNDREPPEARLRLLNSHILQCSIQPDRLINSIRRFINSTYFMYIPMSYKEATNADFPITPNFNYMPEDAQAGLWNIHAQTFAQYAGVIGKDHDDDNTDLIDRLLEKAKKNKLTTKEKEMLVKLKDLDNGESHTNGKNH